LATYFDKSFFPYSPENDINLYGEAFYKKQPKLPKDLADLYYTRSWQNSDRYGDFKYTRLFLGMLNKFFDRSQDEAKYFQSLSQTEQYSERNRLSKRDGDYYWSMRQTTSNKLGLLDESINPSVYHGDLNDDGLIDSADSYYGVGQLIWSLIGRPGAEGRHLHQIQRESMGGLVAKFLDGQIPDAMTRDLLAPIALADDANANLVGLTESASIEYARALANGESPFTDQDWYVLAVLLSTSQHLFLQGRRNLFGWANQAFDQWRSENPADVTTTKTILSTFKSQDQLVFSQQLTGAIDTDPLGAMIHDLSIKIGQSDTVYRYHSVARDSSGEAMGWLFRSQPVDSDAAEPVWVKVSQQADSFEWKYGEYQGLTWTLGEPVADTDLPELGKRSIERRLMAWEPLQQFIQQIVDGAVRYLRTQMDNSDLNAVDLYTQSQTSIQAVIEASSPDEANAAYQQWLQSFPVATLYRALALAESSSDSEFSNYQSLYTIESAGWRNDQPGIAIADGRQVFVDQGYFHRVDSVMSEQLKTDNQLFVNNGVAQSRAIAMHNERRRDKQAMKAAQWVREYKAWRDEQDALLL